RIAEDAGYDFAFLRGVITVNDEQFERVTQKVVDAAGGSLDGVRVGALGLTFKAGTDDLRESPAVAIIERLVGRGAVVSAYDPAVRGDGHGLVNGVAVADDPYAACDGAAVIVVLTEWDEFKWLDLDKLADVVERRNVVDGRNILDRGALLRRGFSYSGIGRR
ncbi:MAG TPA: UDP binding domain-containing protein, partial [Acidimicrobiales bacterium]|nr:UDP binding domain-containing protein [Acidimicrobiales bacterium]